MRINVIRDTDSICLGSVRATVGMRTSCYGTVTKINDKTVIVKTVRGDEIKLGASDISIWYSDAISNDGFPLLDEKDHKAQRKAATIRHFKFGEDLCNQDYDYDHEKLEDSGIFKNETISAGYRFASTVEELRGITLEGFLL